MSESTAAVAKPSFAEADVVAADTPATSVEGTAGKTVDDQLTSSTESQKIDMSELDDQDAAMFGSMAATIADTLADRIDVALVERISALPLLASSTSSSTPEADDTDTSSDDKECKSKSDLLLQMLQRKYLKNVDVVEVYAQRHIFSCSMYPPRRRQKIFQAYLEQREQQKQGSSTKPGTDDDDDKTSPATSGKATSTEDEQPTSAFPSKDQIPTGQAMENLNNEMVQLQEQLKAARIRRNELIVSCKSIELAEQAVQKSLDSLAQCEKDNDVAVNQVHGKVTAALMGHQALEQLGEEGKEMLTKLETRKRERDDDCDDENEDPEVFDFNTYAGGTGVGSIAKRHQKLTLEEEYNEERKQVETNTQSLKAVHKLLNPNASS